MGLGLPWGRNYSYENLQTQTAKKTSKRILQASLRALKALGVLSALRGG